MGAHTAPRTTSVGRVAGRTALTAAAALALTGGTATFAFAGTSHGDDAKSSDCGCDKSWDHDVKADRDWDDKNWDDDDQKSDDWHGKKWDDDQKSDDDDWHGKKSDDDCDDDADHKKWDDKDDHKKWDDRDDHKKWDGKKKDGDKQFGARYEDSTHNGDDNYTVNNITNPGILAGVI